MKLIEVRSNLNKILKNDAWNEIASELSNYIKTATTSNDYKNKIVSLIDDVSFSYINIL